MKEVVLAALLHDIGKFKKSSGIPGDEWALGSEFCRSALPKKLQSIADLICMQADSTALYLTESEQLKAAILADCLSSGDTVGQNKADRIDEHYAKELPAFEPLASILSSVEIGKGEPSPRGFYLPQPLSLDEAVIFPCAAQKSDVQNICRLNWAEFEKDLKRIKEFEDHQAYFTTLYYLLKKHTWSLPADNGNGIHDTALFDHLKTTSAIAACLSGLSGEELNRIALEWSYSREMKRSQTSFLLVCGDISGIQKFIYTITTKGAAKGLRGRSFYLQLLSESLAKFVLKELDLPLTCLLYCGGGHFYILAPAADPQKLMDLRDRAARSLLKIHRGELFLALGWTEIAPRDLRGEVSRIWKEAAASANIEKQKRFSSLAYEYYDHVFGPDPAESAGSGEVCDICKEEGRLWFRDEKGWHLWQGEEREAESKLCDFCRQFEIIGDRLGFADYLVETAGADPESEKDLLFSFEDFGISYYVFSKEALKSWLSRTKVDEANIYLLNSTKFLASEDGDEYGDGDDEILSLAVKKGFGIGFRFIGNVTPIEGRSIKDFEGMAEDAEGIERIGVLRMDVDDLGRIFAEGLREKATLSRVSSLSTLLSIFFDGHLNNICSREKYTNNIYIIYSGGDDLFIVGSWNLIPELAADIRRDFAEFVGRNPNLTISAGISIFERKYPLYRAAEEAHEGLERAKGYKRAGKEKDAISLLSRELSWNEMALSAQMKDLLFRGLKGAGNDTELFDCVISQSGSVSSVSNISININSNSKAPELPKSVLGRLAMIYSLYREGRKTLEKEEKPFPELVRLARFERWRWIMTYSLHRAAKENKAFEDDLRQIEQALSHNRLGDLVSQERDVIEYLDVPVRWADFLTRKEERE